MSALGAPSSSPEGQCKEPQAQLALPGRLPELPEAGFLNSYILGQGSHPCVKVGVCGCARARTHVCAEGKAAGRHCYITCPEFRVCRGQDPSLVREPRPDRTEGLGSSSSLSQRDTPSSWTLEGFTVNSTGAILFILLFGYPHLLKRVQ